MKPKYRTMWMFPRNIRRIEPWKLTQIAGALEVCSGNIRDQSVQDELYRQLSALGVKRKENPNGSLNQGGFRTYLAQLACLGLFWRMDKKYLPTKAGKAIIDGDNPLQVLRCQLLRMQYPSVYGLGQNVRISPELKVKPFLFLLKLFQDERLGKKLSCTDIAIPVVYGKTPADYELCVEKILELRAKNNDLHQIIRDPNLVRTPKRCHEGDPDGDEKDLEAGIQDAFEIANTAKNYLQAALLIHPNEDKTFSLLADPQLEREIASYVEEDKIYPLIAGDETRWQQFFGRYTSARGVESVQKEDRLDGFSILIRNLFISALEDDPFGLDVESFVERESKRWGKPPQDIYTRIESIIPRKRTLERDVLIQASISGGKQAIKLEKGVTNLLRKLGLNESRHIGQLRAKQRDGGFPDIYIYEDGLPVCGLGDTKATAVYDFSIGDRNKLLTYYKECSTEIDSKHPGRFFIYIAGGFGRSTASVLASLKDCTEKFGKPVSAVTVGALLDLNDKREKGLLNLSDRELGRQLCKIFGSVNYFASGLQIENELKKKVG